MDKIIGAAFILVFGFVGYMMFVVAPVAMWADMKCKEKGYPRAEVTINLKAYCLNMDGGVTVKVDELK